jgi:hypothetical protein
LHNYYCLSNYSMKSTKIKIKWSKVESISLKQTRPVHAHGNTTLSGVLGEQVVLLQISKTGNATQRQVATAIRRKPSDDIAKVGVASLHGDETALLWATQNASVVGDGWDVFGTLGTRHVTDSHFV